MNRRCVLEQSGGGMEEGVDDSLWEDFESCAHAVALLYRAPSWRTFEKSAAATTQLYKQGVEAERRAMDRGRVAGRQSLAKEVIACLGTGRIQDLVEMAQRAAQGPSTPSNEESSTSRDSATLDDGVQLFQQALSPPAPASPNRSQLGTFLLRQLRRHRKRSHSPTSSSSPKTSSSSPKRSCRR